MGTLKNLLMGLKCSSCNHVLFDHQDRMFEYSPCLMELNWPEDGLKKCGCIRGTFLGDEILNILEVPDDN